VLNARPPCTFISEFLILIHQYVLFFSAKHLRSKDRAINNHNYPRVHFPEVYILEGGYCQYFRESGARCEPPGYVRMDDPNHAASRKEDLDHFRKGKFGRTKSYAYGDAIGLRVSKLQKHNSNTSQPKQLFTTSSTTRSSCETNDQVLGIVPEDCHIPQSEDEETDIGDSPCPPPSKNTGFRAKKLGLGGTRGPLKRTETWTLSGLS
jgi:M-phase inducer tyrosine phosphatase